MIELRNVSKKYGNFYAVKDVSFTVNEGEIVGFLGRNGAGKTTTMNMITGFIEPSAGDIIINGNDIALKPKKVKKDIGYMPEGTPLYADLTVREFIKYMAELKLIPRKERKAAVEKAIKETGLEKVQKNLTRNLSRGYKQRVSLAAAIVGNPKILILDEPTVGLDPKQVKEIRDLIKSFRKNHTVILSSHILSEISQICEKVIIIDKGEIVAVDTPKNLEKTTEEKSKIVVTIDAMSQDFEKIKEKVKAITNITLASSNEEEKKYIVEYKGSKDIRKEIFSACAALEIVILELKKEEASLESAFIKLVEDRPEYSHDEIKKQEYDKEMAALRNEYELKKEEKARKKEAKRLAKEEKQRQKEEKKKLKNKEKENDTKGDEE